jgi:hypothetical protein
MSYNNFPQQLKNQKQWVLWKKETVKNKVTKIPYKNTAQKASSINSEDWKTFKECESILQNTKYFDGIGYVFNKAVVGIDLDHCFEQDGFTLKQWAKEIIDLFPSYIEISPSGTGLHIFLLCDVKFKGAKHYIENQTEGDAIERYCNGRYFTVTGNVYGDYKELKIYTPEYFLKWHNSMIKESPKIETPKTTTLLPDDSRILEKAFASLNGERIKDLYNGDWQKYKKSQSEADLSLVGSLMFFCDNNTTTVDRIFRTSGLMRPKWNRPDIQAGIFEKAYCSEPMKWNIERDPNQKDDVVIRRLSEVKAKNIEWLIHPVLAKGKLTIFHGEPGKGKSQASIYTAAEVSRGGTYFDGQQIEEGEVLFITSEDEASDTLKPRLMACGANVNNIIELRWIVKKDGKINMFNLEQHIPQLKKAVQQLPNLKLIIIDPISAFLGKVDGNSGGVRGLFAEVKPIVEERGCALLVIAHNNKTSGMRALNKISGNGAFGAATRIAYVFGDNPSHQIIDDEEGKFIMAQSKNNLERQETNSQIYDIEAVEVVEDEVNIKTSRIKWLGESDIKSQEIVDYMPNKKERGRPNDKRQECIDEIEKFMEGKKELTVIETKILKLHLDSMNFGEQLQRKSRQELGINVVRIGNDPYWVKNEEKNLFN